MATDLFYPEKYVLKLKEDMKRFTDLDNKILLNKKKEFEAFKTNLSSKFNTGVVDLKILDRQFFLDSDNREIFESKLLQKNRKQNNL
ncbi:MAG: hypothetical protein PHU47_00370 [Candidatus ainarchaeum sp.]|nr:hypothetical protein [Candidatus ainarchaeum sp.]